MPKRTQSYDAWQMDRLTRPRAAAAFLNAARADSNEMFLVALRKVAQAHQMAKVAKHANVQRESLYRALSEDGNPTHFTLSSVLEALELDFEVVPRAKRQGPNTGARENEKQNAVSTTFHESVADIGRYRSQYGAKVSSDKQKYENAIDKNERNQISSSYDFDQQNLAAGIGA
jgi:probable addiction module antidote protein